MNKVWESTTGRWSQGTQRRRSNSIFTPMSVAHVDSSSDEDSSSDLTSSTATTPSPAELYNAEKVFKNGDFYTGQWVENFPHGHGKYLWSDGCMYVGEWSKGKTNGNGTFSWPSGATYEGEFRGGYMDGRGTYTGSNGDTYRGNWVMNLKHGQGNKSYTNGDYYEGEWKRGLRDGQGRYQWSNGNHYIGQWKDGEMNGNGTFIWVGKGSRYDGYWENGLMKGSGTYRWVDGSFYVGVWSKDREERSGTYYGAGGRETNGEWDQDEVYEIELKDSVVSEGEEIVGFPSQKMVNWPSFDAEMLAKNVVVKVDGKNRRRSVDDRLINGGNGIKVGGFWDDDDDRGSVIGVNKNGKFVRQGSDVSSMIGRELQFHPVVLPKEFKRQGETISKGHKNYELMLNLQLGIRHSVGRPAPATTFDLKASAFDPKEKLWTKFPSEGSKYTPPHSSAEFKWKDYCPLVFRTLRKLFKVDAADYMLSICGDEALRELSSPGKSGSFFYLTNDDKYMIKTMKKAEVKVLLRMLPAYYNHVRAYENTLVTKFFGLHCVKLTGPAQKKVRFVIMGNLFCTKYAIHRRFDLKGSSHGRTTEKPESEIDPTTTLKDLDLNYIFRLQKCWSQEFHRQVDRDCEFLEQEGIMDYSLLVGVHFREASCSKEVANENGFQENEVITPRMSRLDQSDEVIDPDQWTSVRLGINMPVRAELTVRQKPECEGQFLVGDPTGQCFDVVVFFGIIDILQDYDISKKLEHAYKSIQYDPTSISAVDPKQYSRRFRDFIFKVFTEDT